jgi:hypothetical protein
MSLETTQPPKARIKLEDVLLPERRFSTKAIPGRLVSQETHKFILDTISKDPQLQALCLTNNNQKPPSSVQEIGAESNLNKI